VALIVESFDENILEHVGEVMGNYDTGTGLTRLFESAGYEDYRLTNESKWRFVMQSFQDLQQRKSNGSAVVEVLEQFCQPVRWLRRRDQFEEMRRELNAILAFAGLAVNEEGKVVLLATRARTLLSPTNEDAALFDARDFHACVVRHGRDLFRKGQYFHAVFECCKAIDQAVATNAGSSASGRQLMGQAFGASGPLHLNSGQTQSEKDEQEGIMHLMMGLVAAVRNPQAHQPQHTWPMSRADALDLLGFISYLCRKLDGTIVVVGSRTGQFQF